MKDLLTRRSVVVSVGILTIALGLVYYTNVPRMVSDALAPTTLWGRTALVAGTIAVLSSLLGRAGWILGCILLAVIALLQIPPMILWVVFDGTIVGEPKSGAPIGHWYWAIPHILLLALSVEGMFSARKA